MGFAAFGKAVGRLGKYKKFMLKLLILQFFCRSVKSIGNDEVGSSILPSSTMA